MEGIYLVVSFGCFVCGDNSDLKAVSWDEPARLSNRRPWSWATWSEMGVVWVLAWGPSRKNANQGIHATFQTLPFAHPGTLAWRSGVGAGYRMEPAHKELARREFDPSSGHNPEFLEKDNSSD
jgi:hypothetical protein